MIVVSDTSPLNYLILIGHAEVLPILFDRIVAPPAVIEELLHPGSPPPVHAWASVPPAWLEIVSPKKVDSALRLGVGEMAAISIARELNAEMLLVDERKATAVAHRLGLQVVGTLNILALSAERDLINLDTAINALRQTTFREPTKLVEELLRREAERRSGS
jgi:predicted nucleic acid-binding protein